MRLTLLPCLCLLLFLILYGCASMIAHVEFGEPARWPIFGDPLVSAIPAKVDSMEAESLYIIFFDKDGKIASILLVQPKNQLQQNIPSVLSSGFPSFLLGILK